jgi:phosphatidylglycerophosphate synthase
VPKSEIRKKKVYTPPSDMLPSTTASDKRPSPVWLPATAVTLIIAGIGWLVVYYLSETIYPVQAWGYWNLAVGFGAMVAALALLSKWR